MASMEIPAPFRNRFGGKRKVPVAAENLLEALRGLDEHAPDFSGLLVEGRALRRFVRVFVDGEMIEKKDLRDTRLEPESRVRILVGFAGG